MICFETIWFSEAKEKQEELNNASNFYIRANKREGNQEEVPTEEQSEEVKEELKIDVEKHMEVG